MTAETLHDALTLLPADLIAEADRKRTLPRKIIPWKRYAAMAACFVLVVCSGWFCMTHLVGKGGFARTEEAAAEAPMLQAPQAINGLGAEAAPAAPAEPEEDLCALPTAPSITEDTQSSAVVMLPDGILGTTSVCTPRDKASTASFTSDPRIKLLKSRTELDAYVEKYDWQYTWGEFTALCEAYDESWFEDHDLLLLAVHYEPEDGCTISAITETDGVWDICISSVLREDSVFTDWHIFVETEKDHIPNEDAVRLIFE